MELSLVGGHYFPFEGRKKVLIDRTYVEDALGSAVVSLLIMACDWTKTLIR